MGIIKAALAVSIGVLLLSSPAWSGAQKCNEALDDYNTVTKELSDALRDYSHCVAYSKGRRACTAEFSALNGAQDNFETAVAAYKSDCEAGD